MKITNEKSIIYKHDFITEIGERLSKKRDIINVSKIVETTGVPRKVIDKFIKGEYVNTSFNNIAKLYKFIDEQNL